MIIIKSLLDEFMLKLSVDALPGATNYEGEIFHYTSLKNINSILQLTDNKVTLWASRFDCLNDISEGTLVKEIYREACDELKENGQISNEMYNLFSNIPPSRNETFIVWKNGKPKPVRCEFGTYITSFSTEYDLLPMWNYYSKGNMYEGFNIGFSAKEIEESLKSSFNDGSVSISVSPVIYAKEKQKDLIKKLLIELNQKYETGHETSVRAIISMKLTSWQMTFKKECFAHEKEVRIIIKVANKYKESVEVSYRNNSAYIIPYIKLQIDKTAIKSTTLGPMVGNDEQRDLQKNILHEMLTSYGIGAVERCSQIPVRY